MYYPGWLVRKALLAIILLTLVFTATGCTEKLTSVDQISLDNLIYPETSAELIDTFSEYGFTISVSESALPGGAAFTDEGTENLDGTETSKVNIFVFHPQPEELFTFWFTDDGTIVKGEYLMEEVDPATAQNLFNNASMFLIYPYNLYEQYQIDAVLRNRQGTVVKEERATIGDLSGRVYDIEFPIKDDAGETTGSGLVRLADFGGKQVVVGIEINQTVIKVVQLKLR